MAFSNNKDRYQSWGRLVDRPRRGVTLEKAPARLPVPQAKASGSDGHRDGDGGASDSIASLLPFGNGRSYGDSCHNDDGLLLDCRAMNEVISFDRDGGRLRCGAGLLMADLLDLTVPASWFPPVTPGTKFITIGGAIANDVHGKNHHLRGTFGRHVTKFELLRSNGERLLCSRDENVDLFKATIGGLGLTGLIIWAEIELLPISTALIDQEVRRFRGLDEFWDMARETDARFEYSVAWIDSLARGKSLGRGLFMAGNHAAADGDMPRAAIPPPRPKRALRIPLTPPLSLINRASLKLFNSLYYRKQWADVRTGPVPYEPFFYPLDGILEWNRLYGPKGLFQHQSVLPVEPGGSGDQAMAAVKELIGRTQAAGIGSFLTVLKLFGDRPSPGLLSFPQPGLTLTLDFANSGPKTLALLDDLDRVVIEARGRVNPYKDARMSAASFAAFFPNWRDLQPFIDPAFSSSFWRRVTS